MLHTFLSIKPAGGHVDVVYSDEHGAEHTLAIHMQALNLLIAALVAQAQGLPHYPNFMAQPIEATDITSAWSDDPKLAGLAFQLKRGYVVPIYFPRERLAQARLALEDAEELSAPPPPKNRLS